MHARRENLRTLENIPRCRQKGEPISDQEDKKRGKEKGTHRSKRITKQKILKKKAWGKEIVSKGSTNCHGEPLENGSGDKQYAEKDCELRSQRKEKKSVVK